MAAPQQRSEQQEALQDSEPPEDLLSQGHGASGWYRKTISGREIAFLAPLSAGSRCYGQLGGGGVSPS
jgi:hypothetical protein